MYAEAWHVAARNLDYFVQIDDNDDDITPTSEDINIEDTASDDEDDD